MNKSECLSVTFCNNNFLYNVIQSSRSACLIFDIRSTSQIQKSGTILGAVHLKPLRTFQSTESLQEKPPLDITALSDQPLSEGVKNKLKHLKRNYCFLLVSDKCLIPTEPDDDLTQEDVKAVLINKLSLAALKGRLDAADAVSIEDGLELYYAMHAQKFRELYVLGDGAENFLLKYPFLRKETIQENEDEESKTDFLNYPNEIIDQIFLGNAMQVNDKGILQTLKITHVLNTAEEVEVCKEELKSIGVLYSKLPIRDFQDFDISEYFEEAFKNISETLEEDPKNNVLVHCARGMSRSVAIVTMYLMKKNKWTFKKALEFIAKKKSTVNVNIGFEEFLEMFEKNNFEFNGRERL